MKKYVVVGAAVIALAGATAVYAQSRHEHGNMDGQSDESMMAQMMPGQMMPGQMMPGQMMQGPMMQGMQGMQGSMIPPPPFMQGQMGGPGMGMMGKMGRWAGRMMNPDDMAAFANARIAGVKAGLGLNADQEKLWPQVEAAVKDFAKQRIARMTAMRAAAQAGQGPATFDPITMMRNRADMMAEMAAGLKRIAESADPLYKTLNDDQKRRLAMLTRGGWMGGHKHKGWHHGGWRDGAWRGQGGAGPDRL
jgi:hypothetical protein